MTVAVAMLAAWTAAGIIARLDAMPTRIVGPERDLRAGRVHAGRFPTAAAS